MSCYLKPVFSVSKINRGKGSFRVCSSIGTLQEPISRELMGRTFDFSNQKLASNFNAQPSVCISKALRWWEKSVNPNMVEIQSAQELVDYLINAGDKLVILDFYSPGCGGCKSLHPKICQLAEMNPNAIFLKLNYEQHKAMCYALHVHVFPFFRFYRGSDGRVSSFSCTNATIHKFKNALAKHGSDRCSLGPAKGLDESELLALGSIGLISRDLEIIINSTKDDKMEDLVIKESALCKEGSAAAVAMAMS
ncbi:hypothetical protein OROHE_011008 [Orobanche hederae]